MATDDTTPRLQLPFLAAGQAQKHVTLNDSLARLDAMVQAAVRSRALVAQPSSPAEGDAYILPEGATGDAWSARPVGSLAWFGAGAWSFATPARGWLAHVQDEGGFVVRQGDVWRPLGEVLTPMQAAPRLGVNGSADDVNRLVVRGAAALLAAEDGGAGDFRLTLDKASSAATASVVFQTGFSGRAEVGTAGDDDLHLRVSADGTAWRDALVVSTAADEVRLFGGGFVAGRQGTVCYLTKEADSVLVIGPAGGVGEGAFWKGLQLSSPPLSVSGAAAYPRFSTYFSCDSAVDPSRLEVRQQVGNLPDGSHADIVLAPGGEAGSVACERPLRLPTVSVSSLPAAAAHGAGAVVYVADAAGGATLAVSDGVVWRRTSDRAVVG